MKPDDDGVFFQVVVIGAGGQGVFLYNASGQLIDSMAITANVDPLTSSNVTGIANQAPVGAVWRQVQIDSGVVNFNSSGISIAGPWSNIGALGLQQFSGGGSGVLGLTATGGFIVGSTPGGTGGLFFVNPSGDVTGASDTLTLGGAIAVGLTPVLLPGTFYLNPGNAKLTALPAGQYIYGSGIRNTLINGVGTGTIFACHSTSAEAGAGGLVGFYLDMNGMGAGSIGIDVGDVVFYEIDALVANSPAQGFRIRNTTGDTERLHGNLYARNCVQGVVYDRTGGTTSMARTEVTHWITSGDPSHDGVVINDVLPYHGRFDIRGNFAAGAGTNVNAISGTQAAVLKIIGTNGKLLECQVDIGAECSAGANTAMSVFFGASANNFDGCYGVLGFDQGAQSFTGSNTTGSGSFFGPIRGDANLLPVCRLNNTVKFDSGLSIGHSNAAQALVNGSTITTAGLTYAPCSLAAAVTGIIMQAGTLDGQLIYVSLESTVASGFTVTFAAAGSNVRDPADTIAAGTAALFCWNIHVTQWIRVK